MSERSMHADQLVIDEPLVRRLLADQFPVWTGLALRRVASPGTENALFRLGADLVVRLPLRPGKEAQVEKDHRWLPILAPQLPLPIPTPVARGAPCAAYPSPWSVCPWLAGEEATLDRLDDPCRAARDLADFVRALQRIDATGGPVPGAHNFQRGVPLVERDALTRASIARCTGLLDTNAVLAAWERDLAAPVWSAPPVWIHGDLSPDNLLAQGGRLRAVIDWGGLGVGDPATELQPAWNLFRGESRRAFREAMGVDDATWSRGRGLTLSVALVALPYYLKSNPAMVRAARTVLDEILSDADDL